MKALYPYLTAFFRSHAFPICIIFAVLGLMNLNFFSVVFWIILFPLLSSVAMLVWSKRSPK